MERKPGDKLGPYEIVSAIGKGMGEVWKARDPRLGRDVPIKVSPRQFDWRFEREASMSPAQQSYQIKERFSEYYAELRFTMQSNSSFAAAVYVAARETPI
jgi:hypothetical protein